MFPLSGAVNPGTFGSTTTTMMQPQPQQSGGMLSGMPAGIGSLPGMVGNGYGAATGSSLSGGSASPMSSALFWAALIGAGKNVENSNANNGLGKGLLAFMGPSIHQVSKD